MSRERTKTESYTENPISFYEKYSRIVWPKSKDNMPLTGRKKDKTKRSTGLDQATKAREDIKKKRKEKNGLNPEIQSRAKIKNKNQQTKLRVNKRTAG